MDEEGGRPGAGTRHATPPPAGAAAGGRARTIAPYAAPHNGATLKDNNTGLDGGQDNGESSDAAQQHVDERNLEPDRPDTQKHRQGLDAEKRYHS
jgi:hypothetical protein